MEQPGTEAFNSMTDAELNAIINAAQAVLNGRELERAAELRRLKKSTTLFERLRENEARLEDMTDHGAPYYETPAKFIKNKTFHIDPCTGKYYARNKRGKLYIWSRRGREWREWEDR